MPELWDALMQGQAQQPVQPRLAPGMFEPGNIDLNSRPRVYNPDGSISTVRSIGANLDGREVLLPTVRKDPFHPFGGSIMSNDDAIAHYRNTGQHLGRFDTPQNSDAYARTLHEAQGQQYAPQASVPLPRPNPLRPPATIAPQPGPPPPPTQYGMSDHALAVLRSIFEGEKYRNSVASERDPTGFYRK